MTAWPRKIDPAFQKLTKSFEQKITSLKEKAAVSTANINTRQRNDWGRDLERFSAMRVAQEPPPAADVNTIIQPYHHIPFPENNAFCGQTDELAYLRASLDHSDSIIKHRSLSIWGTGRVGKSQVAIAYTYERKRAGVSTII